MLLTLLPAYPSHAATPSGANPALSVPYTRIGLANSPHNNFLVNWDSKKHPLFYAMMNAADQYGRYFHPAPVMVNQGPTMPDPALFEKEQILVLARVMRAPKVSGTAFRVESLVEKDQELELRYRFTRPRHSALFRIKDGLALQLPKRHFSRLVIYENNRRVGVLDFDGGQWMMSASPQSANGLPVLPLR